MGEKRNCQCYFDIETEKQIVADYVKGEGGTSYLAKKYHAPSVGTIFSILKAHNVPRRSLSEARRIACGYTVDETVFERIDTREKAYWLGMMYSDGYISCISPYTKVFGLSAHERDKDIIEKFKNFLNYSGAIGNYETTGGYKAGTKYSRIVVGNNKIVEDLQRHGLPEHKSLILKAMPDIFYKDDFVRGVIDGDGSITKKLGLLAISGTHDFLLSIAEYFGLPYRLTPDRSIWCLAYNAQESRYITTRLYQNAPVYLNRKYELAKRYFNSPITLEDVIAKSELQGKS